MKWAKVVEKLHRYFEYIGISYQFNHGGRFAHIDIDAALTKAFSPEMVNEEERLSLISAIEEWDGSFEMLYTVERDLEKLTLEAIIPTNISQNILMEKWRKFSRLVGWPVPEELENGEGYCSGITDASGVGILLKQNPNLKLDPTIPVDKFIHFEDVMYRIQGWDGHTVNSVIQSDFEFFRDYVLVFQERQNERNRVINELVKRELIADLQCDFSWVHDNETLKFLILKMLTPGKYTKISANRHAAHIFVTSQNEILYFNTNEPFGNLLFKDIQHFLYRFPQAFNNCYSNRFGLTVAVFDLTGSLFNVFDLKSLIQSMLSIQLKQKSTTNATNNADISTLTESDKYSFINRQDSNGMTALHMSCLKTNPEEVRLLVEAKANPNLKELTHLETPLHLAVNSVACMENLRQSDLLEMNEINKYGFAPLHAAVLAGFSENVACLIADPRVRINLPAGKTSIRAGFTALHMAAKCGHTEIVTLLVNHPDIMINQQEKTSGLTALHLAVESGNLQTVQAFLECKDKLKLNLRSQETGKTVLGTAMELEDLDIAVALFQAGADMTNLPMTERWKLLAALLDSSSENVSKIVQSAISSHELIIDTEDENFLAFLEKGIIQNKVELLELFVNHQRKLLDVTITLDAETEQESTYGLLHLAIINEAVQSIEFLLQQDVTLLDKKDSSGITPRMYAKYSKENKLTIDRLLEMYSPTQSAETPCESQPNNKLRLSDESEKIAEIQPHDDELSNESEKVSITDVSMFKKKNQMDGAKEQPKVEPKPKFCLIV